MRKIAVLVKYGLLVGTANGRLVAINTRDKTLTGWTQWGGDARRSASR